MKTLTFRDEGFLKDVIKVSSIVLAERACVQKITGEGEGRLHFCSVSN